MKKLDEFIKSKNELFKAFKIPVRNFDLDIIEDKRTAFFYLKESINEIVWVPDKEQFDEYSSEYHSTYTNGNFMGIILVGEFSDDFSLAIFDCKNRLTDSEAEELWDEA